MILERAVLLVHDVTNEFLDDPDPTLPLVLANIRTLVVAARRAALPVVFAAPGQGDPSIGPMPHRLAGEKLVWGSAGVDVPADIGPRPGDNVVRKPRYGAFFGTDFAVRLREQHHDTVVLCGLSLAGGVETTVRDAYNYDLQSVVVADACLCRAVADQGWGNVAREDVARVVLSVLAQRFAEVTTTAAFCARLASR